MDFDEKNLKKDDERLTIKSVVTILIVAIIVAFVTSSLTYKLTIEKLIGSGYALDLKVTDVSDKSESSDTLLNFFNNSNQDVNISYNDKNIEAISESLKRFRTVIDKYYKGDIDENALLDGAIKGYVEGLGDKYTSYMTEDEWKEFEESALGNFVGIGIYMIQNEEYDVVEVVSTIQDSPAEAVGILSGDFIVEVDGESMIGVNSDTVASKIKGDEGTKVNVKVLRGDEYKTFEITRASIKVYHVLSKVLEDNIGYIQLLTFDEGCSIEFHDKLQELSDAGVDKLIIDLRSNTGGIVDEALNIIDLFVEKGNTMLITENKNGDRQTTYAKADPMVKMKVVILTNGYTASASEILAGALVDNEIAKTVGTKTYGKGVIQQIFSLKDGGALKITTEEYYTPKENKIHQIGISPDYEIEYDGNGENDNQLQKAIEIIKGE